VKIKKVRFKAKNILSIMPNQPEAVNDFRPLSVATFRIMEDKLKPNASQVQKISAMNIFYLH
jgi:hypothetical protein